MLSFALFYPTLTYIVVVAPCARYSLGYFVGWRGTGTSPYIGFMRRTVVVPCARYSLGYFVGWRGTGTSPYIGFMRRTVKNYVENDVIFSIQCK